jgi:hypothetical protein
MTTAIINNLQRKKRIPSVKLQSIFKMTLYRIIKVNNKKKARSSYEKSLTLNPGNDSLKQKLQKTHE